MTKIDQLKKDERELIDRLGELDQEQKTTRAAMVEDPIHTAAALSGRLSQIQIQIEVFNEKLAQVKAAREAEEARINSPEVKRNIKQAEKNISELDVFCKESIATLNSLLDSTVAMIAQASEAANTLKASGREPLAPMGVLPQYLQHTKQMLDTWKSNGAPIIQSVKARN